MTFEEFLTDQCGYSDVRMVAPGLYAAIRPFLFTSAVVTVRAGDTHGCDDRWCYHSHAEAKAALDAWNGEGEPGGWHRHPASGRRRGDDPPPWAPPGATEWIAP